MNVTLYGKKDFTEVIKLKILRWGDYTGLSGCTLNVITKVHNDARDARGSKEEKDDVKTEAEFGVIWLRTKDAKATSGGWKRQGTNSPLDQPEGTSPVSVRWILFYFTDLFLKILSI